MAQEKGLSFQVLQMIDDQISTYKRILIQVEPFIELRYKKARSASIGPDLKVHKFVYIIKITRILNQKINQSFSRKVNSPSSEVILILTLR